MNYFQRQGSLNRRGVTRAPRLCLMHHSTIIPALAMALAAFVVGCQEPNYRNEVVGNGQGGIEIRHVAKDIPAAEDPSIDASIDQRIAVLEDHVRKENLEIDRLKRMKAAATSPTQ